MAFKFRYVQGHVEVLDDKGHFLFSADDHREAMEELETYQQRPPVPAHSDQAA